MGATGGKSWIDLDANATTKPAPEVVRAVLASCESQWANPSSMHRAGQRARAAVELARKEVATLIGASPHEIVFCSCATESIHLAIRSMVRAPDDEVLTSHIEHAAIGAALATIGATARCCDVLASGLLDVDDAIAKLDGACGLATHLVNNETGAIQPLRSIIDVARDRSLAVFIDATQAVGRVPVDVSELGADYVAFSPHKFHAIKGVGVLYVRERARLRPLIGGAQELARRGGTESVPAICGAGIAASLAREWLQDPEAGRRQGELRELLEQSILGACPGSSVNGPDEDRLWTTTNISFPGIEAEALLLMLSERGVGASAGAACSSGSLEPSLVLAAMGLGEDRVRGSIRLSLSRLTSADEIERAVEIIVASVRSLGASV